MFGSNSGLRQWHHAAYGTPPAVSPSRVSSCGQSLQAVRSWWHRIRCNNSAKALPSTESSPHRVIPSTPQLLLCSTPLPDFPATNWLHKYYQSRLWINFNNQQHRTTDRLTAAKPQLLAATTAPIHPSVHVDPKYVQQHNDVYCVAALQEHQRTTNPLRVQRIKTKPSPQKPCHNLLNQPQPRVDQTLPQNPEAWMNRSLVLCLSVKPCPVGSKRLRVNQPFHKDRVPSCNSPKHFTTPHSPKQASTFSRLFGCMCPTSPTMTSICTPRPRHLCLAACVPQSAAAQLPFAAAPCCLPPPLPSPTTAAAAACPADPVTPCCTCWTAAAARHLGTCVLLLLPAFHLCLHPQQLLLLPPSSAHHSLLQAEDSSCSTSVVVTTPAGRWSGSTTYTRWIPALQGGGGRGTQQEMLLQKLSTQGDNV